MSWAVIEEGASWRMVVGIVGYLQREVGVRQRVAERARDETR